jgi:uncharacterized protein YjbJ (UPF0337 family)
MDWDRIEGNWKQFKGRAKENWGLLTDDDLSSIGGRRDQLEGVIQERYGYAKDRTRQEVDQWMNSAKEAVGDAGQSAAQVLAPFEKAFQQSLRDQPVATLAMIGALGFVLGALWKS